MPPRKKKTEATTNGNGNGIVDLTKELRKSLIGEPPDRGFFLGSRRILFGEKLFDAGSEGLRKPFKCSPLRLNLVSLPARNHGLVNVESFC